MIDAAKTQQLLLNPRAVAHGMTERGFARLTAAEVTAQTLADAGRVLELAAGSLAGVRPGLRALRRLASALTRPMRIAVMGEVNSGKSTIVNLLLGDATLPALPFANTRLPTLLRYAPRPKVHGRMTDGQVIGLESEAGINAKSMVRLEVSLPSPVLQTIEFMDFPGLANPTLGWSFKDIAWLRTDATIWATVATQAWRESERAAWQLLPERMRANSLLAVTHCDLIRSRAELQALEQRLLPIAAELFGDIAFLAVSRAGKPSLPMPLPPAHTKLAAAVERMRTVYLSERGKRAALLAAGIAGRTLQRLELAGESDAEFLHDKTLNGTSSGSGASMNNNGTDDNLARVRDVLQKLQTLQNPVNDGPAQRVNGKPAPSERDGIGSIMERKQAVLGELAPRKTAMRRSVALYAIAFVLIAGLIATVSLVVPIWRKDEDKVPAASAKNLHMMKILADARARLADGDVVAARTLLKESASETAEIAFLLAQTYDPNYLQSLPKRNAAPDRNQAERWYKEWYELATRSGLNLDPERLKRIINAMPTQK